MTEAMEEKTKLIESLLERVAEYGKTSYELIKLKALDKTTDIVSSLIPNAFVFVFVMLFMLFFNLGLAFWLGEMLGSVCFGFFVVAAFYGIIAILLHVFMHQWIKKSISNFIIKQVLK